MVLAIDIGGTYIKYGYVTDDQIAGKGKWETMFSFPMLCAKIDTLLKPNIERIAISSGGFWSHSGEALGYQTIAETKTNNLSAYFEQTHQLRATIQNDARCALLCEKAYGSIRQCENAVIFVLGSSVGCAAMINGRLLEGAAGKAAMLFKMPENLTPYQYEQDANTLVQTAKYKKMFNRPKCNMQDLETLARGGDAAAEEILLRYCKAVAQKFFYAKLMYDPQKIIVGGGVANSHDIMDKIKKEYRQLLAVTNEEDNLPIERTAFGEDSNLIGAALWKPYEAVKQ